MRKLRDFKKSEERRRYLEDEKSISLDAIGNTFQDSDDIKNCENIIGAASVPMGVAGPISVQGSYAEGEFVVPLATTEGALVASISRGTKAVSADGPVRTHVHRVGTTRGPVFYVGSIEKNTKFYEWLKENESELKKVAESTSNHLKYRKMKTAATADYRFINFYFNTNDAMGMNMVTIATQAIVDYIEDKTEYSCLSVAGNYDVDKKPSWMNFTNSRGFKVWAEAIVSEETLKSVLKTSAQEVYDVWLGKCMLGSAMSGSMGFNAHFANVVSAFFIAMGQDPAHVVEGSTGVTTTKVLSGKDLYVSIYMPSVLIGTVGAGMKLKTQREALSLIGVETSEELGEVLGATVLAGEVSLLSSLSKGSLAKAHEKLGR